MKKIIILTGSELRHSFLRRYLALSEGIYVIRSYCEGMEGTLNAVVENDELPNEIRMRHILARESSEKDFFKLFTETVADRSNPVFLPRGAINYENYIKDIIDAAPDLLIAYGCSIIKQPLLKAFKDRIINVHLGLSPYYRGSGTNYWPLVNREPEYVGATFMYMDAGIDTGEVIHQIRAKCCWGDSPSQIGNRLIVDMADIYRKIIIGIDNIKRIAPLMDSGVRHFYRKRDYTEQSVETLYQNFSSGLIETFLSEEKFRCLQAPIITNPSLEPD